MWKFYWNLARSIPETLWTAYNRWVSVSAFLAFLFTLFGRSIGGQYTTTLRVISPWWSLLPIGLLFLYGLMKVNYDHYQKLEGTSSDSLASLKAENARLKSMLDTHEGELSQKAIEILLATYEGLKNNFPGIFLVDNMQSKFVRAGVVNFCAVDPAETAEYAAEVELLLQAQVIRQPSITPYYYELSAKGLKKGKELFEQSEALEILKDLHKKFSPKRAT